jgi:phosphatidylglycerophosphate synthase
MNMTSLRDRIRHLGEPLALFFGRLGLTPNGLTLIGFGISVIGGILAAVELWLAAAFIVFIGGAFDMFDGSLARATGTASNLGAFLDSLFDRWGEAIVYLGIIVGCLSAGFNPGAALAAYAMSAAFLVSYARARAESLGFSPGKGMAKVGLAPREIRLIILSLAILAAGLAGGVAAGSGQTWLAAGLGLIGILATITVIQRIISVMQQAAPSGK